MITKMKKITALVFHREYETFLTDMQRLGVVHVQPAQEGTLSPDSSLQAELDRIKTVQAAIDALKAIAASRNVEATTNDKAEADAHTNEADATQASSPRPMTGEEALACYDRLIRQRQQLQAEQTRLKALLKQVKPWGDFKAESLNFLAEAGYEMTFFTTPSKTFKNNEKEWNSDGRFTFLVHQESSTSYFVVVAPAGAATDLVGATRTDMPEMTATPCAKAIEEAPLALDRL